MANLLLVLNLLPLLGCLFALTAKKSGLNAYNVSMFTLITGVVVVLRLFSELGAVVPVDGGLTYSLMWLESAHIELSFRLDAFALLLLLGVYLAFIIGLVGLTDNARRNKILHVWFLFFLWQLTGFFTADDMVSFYLFFAGMLIPLFMLVGGFGNIKKNTTLSLFFLFNFGAVLVLLLSMLLAYRYYHGNLQLNEIALVDMPPRIGLAVWGGVCLAFMARVPIWPFHYWISTINSGIKNPLVYLMTNLMPLTGLYGFMRFWQLTMAESVRPYVTLIVACCLLTMVFIVLIGIAHKEFLYKLFAYMTVYYLLFLLAEVLLSAVLLADTLKMNIAYSLFIFLLVTSSLAVIDLRMEKECLDKKCDYRGILAYMPKRSRMFALFVLVALGLPLSSMFWNNFIIISALFTFSFVIGITVMAAISLIAISMIYELYILRDLKNYSEREDEVEDMDNGRLAFFIGIISIIFLSFFNPLWFVL